MRIFILILTQKNTTNTNNRKEKSMETTEDQKSTISDSERIKKVIDTLETNPNAFAKKTWLFFSRDYLPRYKWRE